MEEQRQSIADERQIRKIEHAWRQNHGREPVPTRKVLVSFEDGKPTLSRRGEVLATGYKEVYERLQQGEAA